MIEATFSVILFHRAIKDLQDAINYYNSKENKLGLQFYKSFQNSTKPLKKNPNLYQVKYKDIRCVKLKGFPYCLHYKVDESKKLVQVYAVVSTYKNPETNWI